MYPMSEGTRRLAAIMFTDIAGYTSLAQRDEVLAIRLLEEHRALVRPSFPKHGGREVKTIGDAFLVEFDSALEAVRCAYDVQQSLHELNQGRPADRKIEVRVGIHLGDVIRSQNDIYGDAVNVASRIEPLAVPGGICISEQVHDQVKNKLEFPLASLGRMSLKNVSGTVEVFRVILPWERQDVVGQGPDRSRVAVLPFANMSPDPNDEFFADGMTEELISTLSRIRGLKVISRTSAMRYKDTSKSVGEIAKELNVGSLVEGSVRKASDDLRISAQLIDGRSDEHLWSQDYDRRLENVFAVQREIAQSVAEALRVELLPSERKDLGEAPTGNPEAYTLYLKGRHLWNERSREGTDSAIKYFEKAIEVDPKFALAFAGLSDSYLIYQNYGWWVPREAFPKAKEFSLKAIELNPRLAEAHVSLASILAEYEHRWQRAEEEYKLAATLKASYSTTYHWYSLLLRFVGRLKESLAQIERASSLDPLSQVIGVNLGIELVSVGRVEEAIGQLRKMVEYSPEYPQAHCELGWAYYAESRNDEALDELRKSTALSGGDPHYKGELACLLGFLGMREEANSLIDELLTLSERAYVNKVKIAFALFGAGRRDEAFDNLEKGYEDGSDTILYFRSHLGFEDFTKDTRWVSLEKRLGLPPV